MCASALVLIALVVCLNLFCPGMKAYLEPHVDPLYREWGDLVLVALAGIYALLLAIPFVPGVELGWAVMMWFGVKGIAIIYAATVLALALNYGIGTLVPFRWVAWLLRWLQLHRAEQFVLSIIGGGGGIALLAGMSGIYSFAGYLATVAIAISPVPLIFLANHWLLTP